MSRSFISLYKSFWTWTWA